VSRAVTRGEADRQTDEYYEGNSAYFDNAKEPRVNSSKIKNVHVHVIIKYWKGWHISMHS